MFKNIIEKLIKNKYAVVAQIWNKNILLFGKEFIIDDYEVNEDGSMILYDYIGQPILCPNCDPEYDENEDVYIYQYDNLTLRIFF